MSVYDEIQKSEESAPNPVGLAPEHGMLFKTADDTELADFRVIGTLPVPAVGDVILLHWQHVTVTGVRMHYGRDEATGRPLVFTSVCVEASPSAPA